MQKQTSSQFRWWTQERASSVVDAGANIITVQVVRAGMSIVTIQMMSKRTTVATAQMEDTEVSDIQVVDVPHQVEKGTQDE